MKKDFTKPKRRTLPPSRALLATLPDGRQASATWVLVEGRWKCLSASRALRWMRGRFSVECQGSSVKPPAQVMKEANIRWHWITPNYGRAVAPPFGV